MCIVYKLNLFGNNIFCVRIVRNKELDDNGWIGSAACSYLFIFHRWTTWQTNKLRSKWKIKYNKKTNKQINRQIIQTRVWSHVFETTCWVSLLLPRDILSFYYVWVYYLAEPDNVKNFLRVLVGLGSVFFILVGKCVICGLFGSTLGHIRLTEIKIFSGDEVQMYFKETRKCFA